MQQIDVQRVEDLRPLGNRHRELISLLQGL
jgi:hypothetical protein